MTINDYFPASSFNVDIGYALLIADNNTPISIVDSDSFQDFLTGVSAGGKRYSRTHITKTSIPKCVKKMKEFMLSKLKGKSVCLVIDEMTKFNTSYTNVLLCSKIVLKDNKEINAVFFWDTLVLEDGSSASIGRAVSCIADDLEKEGIMVSSFASDNCSAMRKAEEFVVTQSGRKIPRVSCGSHALNNVFKDIMKEKPLDSLWKNVVPGSLS